MAKKNKLDVAVQELGRYFGTVSTSAFYDKLLENEGIEKFETIRSVQDKPVRQSMGDLILSHVEGGHRTTSILDYIDQWLSGTPPAKSANESGDDSSPGTEAAAEDLRKILEIVFEPEAFTSNTVCVAKTIPKVGGKTDGDRVTFWSGSYDDEKKDDVAPKLAAAAPIDSDEADLYETEHAPSVHLMVGSEALLDQTVEAAGGGEGPQKELAEKLKAAKNINKNIKNPTRAEPVLSAFMIKPASLTPANRDTGALGIFLNFIPSQEMSRCQPWLNIQIISSKPTLNAEGVISTMSIAQFLMGNVKVESSQGADYNIVDAVNADMLKLAPKTTDEAGNEKPDVQFATAGMELFTSPQTLVDANDSTFQYLDGAMEHTADEPGGFEGSRAAPIIDKFRPFMSITGFEVTVTPSYGMMAHETATLSIILHDRSRLAEIGELVKPDLYGGVELLIEYGWNHPDAEIIASTSINPIGNFLNEMKAKKKFKVRNSSFSFDNVGQVEIKLELFSVGTINLDTSHIGKMPGMEATVDKLNEAFKVIRRIKQETETGEQGASDTTGETFSLGSVDSLGEIAAMDDETLKQLREYMAQQRKAANDKEKPNAVAAEVLKALEDALTASGELRTSVAMALEVKKKHVISSCAGDPFWRPIAPPDETAMPYFPKIRLSASSPAFSYERVIGARKNGQSEDAFEKELMEKTQASKVGHPFVSLGKLLLLYVGTPLATDAAFDEVQFYFYAFNSNASFMHRRNIAEFPIATWLFFEELDKITQNSAFVSLRRFLGMIQSKFIGKSDNEAWGLSSLYTINDDGNRVLKEEWQKDPIKLKDHKTRVLAAAYGETDLENPTRPLIFRKPRIAAHMEGLPAAEASEDGVDGKACTILRFHIYDKACTSYTGVQQLLMGKRQGHISAVSKEVREIKRETDKTDRADHEKALQDILKKADEEWGLLEKSGENPPITYRVKGSFSKLKAFIKSAMPSATYGTGNSAIINASVSSMNDPQLASIMMQRASSGGASTALSSRSAGVPMRTVPVEVELEVFGCPIVAYGQQIFIDFGTGTTVDNIYAVNGITHSISTGEFVTKIKLVQLDAFGKYEGMLTQLNSITNEVAKSQE